VGDTLAGAGRFPALSRRFRQVKLDSSALIPLARMPSISQSRCPTDNLAIFLVKSNAHRPAAHFAVVIDIGGHFGKVWRRHFELLEATGAGDGNSEHIYLW